MLLWYAEVEHVEAVENGLARVRAGLRRAKLEGRVLAIDRPALLRNRARGLSLARLAKAYKISRTSVARILKQSEGVAISAFLAAAANAESTTR